MLAGVRVRLLASDEHFSLRGDTLKAAIEQDRAKGLIPFYVRTEYDGDVFQIFDKPKC